MAASPNLKARTAGGLYLVVIATGLFALSVRSAVLVRGDAAATAANILASEPLFRIGFVADLISAGAYLGVTLLLYELFRPVSRSVALLSAFLGIAGTVMMASNLLNLLAALLFLGGGSPAPPLAAEQAQSLAMASLSLHAAGFNISLVAFAAHLLSLGYLILRSTFLPSFLGVLLAIAGLSWSASSFAYFLSPPLSASLFPYILLPGLLAEGGLALWLLLVGVNAARWRETSAAAASSRGEPK